jgi:hypothetical protein
MKNGIQKYGKIKNNKMASEKNNSTGGIGILGLMFLIFMTLKLVGVINWSWWWVTAPLWGGIVLWVLIVLILFFILKR